MKTVNEEQSIFEEYVVYRFYIGKLKYDKGFMESLPYGSFRETKEYWDYTPNPDRWSMYKIETGDKRTADKIRRHYTL